MGFAQCPRCDQEMEHFRVHDTADACLEEALAQKEDLASECLRLQAKVKRLDDEIERLAAEEMDRREAEVPPVCVADHQAGEACRYESFCSRCLPGAPPDPDCYICGAQR